MAKFYLFVHVPYDAPGGMDDYIGSFDTIQAARRELFARRGEEHTEAHIATLDESADLVIVEEYRHDGKEWQQVIVYGSTDPRLLGER